MIQISISFIIACLALLTFIKAVLEYRLQGKQKRAELFHKYKTILSTDERIIKVTRLLESDSIELRNISLSDRYYFLGFFEQIAIAMNSNLLKIEVAHYMFAYFAIQCHDSINFWDGINKESYYWSLFNHFSLKMKKIENMNSMKTTNKLQF